MSRQEGNLNSTKANMMDLKIGKIILKHICSDGTSNISGVKYGSASNRPAFVPNNEQRGRISADGEHEGN